jgi:L1 cell adhesion molecule like protein
MKKPIAIGIDLGTTYSCVGVYRNNRVEIIQNEQGHSISPSMVSFNEVGRAVGDAARLNMTKNPKNTVYEIKRLIGKKFSDPTVQEDIKLWPFKVVSDPKERAVVSVQEKSLAKTYQPEEISSMILS